MPNNVVLVIYGRGYNKILGSGELSGKMLLVRIFENNKIDAHFKEG